MYLTFGFAVFAAVIALANLLMLIRVALSTRVRIAVWRFFWAAALVAGCGTLGLWLFFVSAPVIFE